MILALICPFLFLMAVGAFLLFVLLAWLFNPRDDGYINRSNNFYYPFRLRNKHYHDRDANTRYHHADDGFDSSFQQQHQRDSHGHEMGQTMRREADQQHQRHTSSHSMGSSLSQRSNNDRPRSSGGANSSGNSGKSDFDPGKKNNFGGKK